MTTETGKITHILESQSGESKGKKWQKKTIVIKTNEKYHREVIFDLWNDLCNIEINVGDEIQTESYASGREYNGKWYNNNLKCSKLTILKKQAGGKPTFEQEDLPLPKKPDDIPF